MARMTRVASSVLLASGIGLVLLGLSAALGFSMPGVLASIAAAAALLYAGSVWFGDRNGAIAPSVLVFNRELRLVGGPHAGEPVVSRFPAGIREEIEHRCSAAVAGYHSRFTCIDRGRERVFDVAPVVSGHSSEICGVLVEGVSASVTPIPVDAAVGVI